MAVLEVVVIFLGHHCCHLAGVCQLCPEICPKERENCGVVFMLVYVKERRKEETFP